MSVERKQLSEMNTEEVARALREDKVLHLYATVVEELALDGAYVIHTPMHVLAERIGMNDEKHIAHLGALVMMEKAPRKASTVGALPGDADAHALRQQRIMNGDSSTKEQEQLRGELSIMKYIRTTMDEDKKAGVAAEPEDTMCDADCALGVEVEDTPRDEEGLRVAPIDDSNMTPGGKGKRLSNAQIRKSLVGGGDDELTPRGSIAKKHRETMGKGDDSNDVE